MSGAADERTAAAWREAVHDAERRGEHLTAFDLAERAVAQHPDDVWLAHRAVLALARAGSIDEARRRFDEYGLDEVDEEDVAGLRARLEKDAALASEGVERRRRASHAAALYEETFARAGGYYSGVNAATLAMLAGEGERARELARAVLALVAGHDEGSYYEAATEAEAQLLLGDAGAAADALACAAGLHEGDYGAVATTRRQLRLVCEATGIDADVLRALPPPTVVHYCGHRISRDGEHGFPPGAEPAIANRVGDEIRHRPPAFAYGALANGGDILWAEALLAAGADLHVVLPFAREEFVRSSVADAGGQWVNRFERCLSAATSVSYGTENAFQGDDGLHRYGSELAMGLALLHARAVDAEARQLAVWDRRPPAAVAGTAVDVATWRRRGLQTTVVPPEGDSLADAVPAERASYDPAPSGERIVCAMLFADVKGFSKLTDEQLLPFARRVLGGFATVLARHGSDVLYRNTWGDGIYVVLSDATTAAWCALELQGAMQSLDLATEGLPEHLALRLGGHVGPIFRVVDPVLQAPAFIGAHVSRTARIEPVTPPGIVYVTEPFAAALALAGSERFSCDYVGHMPAAKDYGALRMYKLRARAAAP